MKVVVIFACALVCLACIARDVSAQIRLNELLADPASDWDGDAALSSRNDEWVEIVNVGSSTVDLLGYRLADASGGFAWRYGLSGTLLPGQTRVVYGSDALAWEGANGFPAQGLSLNNAGDTVSLYELVGSDTVLVDQYTYVSHEVADDRVAGRTPDGIGVWVVFDALNPYGGTAPPLGNGCAPTPGFSNTCGTTPVEQSTWGAIKEHFRY